MDDIVFMGSPDFAVPSLAALGTAGYRVTAVYTQPDRPSGRGRKLAPSPVKVWAAENGLRVFQPRSLRSPEAIAQLRDLRPVVIVLVAYGKLLPEAVLAIPPKGVLNVHPSLLPRYRGPSPVPAAIMAGDKETGVSIMLLDAGMDTGPVLAREVLPIEAEDTAGTLGERAALAGSRLLLKTLEGWLCGDMTPQPQEEALATYSRKLEKQDGEIRWAAPAEEIARQVRALNPWPGAYTKWRGMVLKVQSAVPTIEDAGEPGTVVVLPGGRVGVATGPGTLVLDRVQLEGRQQMTARDLVAGRRELIGSRLPS